MAGIFISYRRQEASGHAGRLYDALSQRFGEQQVFMDVGIEPGVDFVETIKDTIRSCHVLVAVIGERWTLVQDEDGRRRLEDPGDFIRLEIESALARPDLRVVPVLVQGAKMPESEDLPPTLAALARRNAIELSDGRWRYDVERLLVTIERILEPAAEPPAPATIATSAPAKRATPGRRRGALAGAGALALAGVVALAVLVLGGGDDDAGPVAPRVALSAIPDGWPRELRLGLEEHPDAAKTVASQVGPELRYKPATDVMSAVDDARSGWKEGAFPALAFYRLWDLAKDAGHPMGKADYDRTLNGLNDPAVMKLWFGEYVEFLRAAKNVAKPMLLNLEPNLWGFAQLEPRQEKVPAAVPIGLGQRLNAPIRADGDLTEFASTVVKLRDKLARNVLLAWNLREWGANGDLTRKDPGDDDIDRFARASWRFYEAVGADFDLAFFDATDEDGLEWTAARAANQLRYLRQFMRHSELRALIARIPIGKGRWYLARDNLGDAVDAGVLGLLFRGKGDRADRAEGRRYRTVAAGYYDKPARLTR